MKEIVLRLNDDGEEILVNLNSIEEVLNWCKNALGRNYIYFSHSLLGADVDYCYLSSYPKEIGYCIHRNKKQNPFESDLITPYSKYEWILKLRLDYKNAQVTWQIGKNSWSSPMPPNRPIYLVYSTGFSVSGAEFLLPSQYPLNNFCEN